MGDVKSEKICDDMEKSAKKFNELAHDIDACIERNRFNGEPTGNYQKYGFYPCDHDSLENRFKDILRDTRPETQEYMKQIKEFVNEFRDFFDESREE